ncbi:MAG: hypothetical protein ACLFQV_08155 [Vulcanimicrobiota bacterium]
MVGEAVLLEYKMKKGETLTYKTTVHSEQEIKTEEQSGSTKSDVEMKMSQTCTEVAPDGTMTVDVTIDSGKLIRDGESEELPNVGQTITLKMKKSGEITHTSIDLPFEQPAFPTNNVKKGETWVGKSKISIPGKSDMITLNYNYSLWSFTNVNGYDVAEIKVSCPETKIPIAEGVEQVLTAEGTTHFAHKVGRLVKSEVTTTTNITTQDGSVNTTIKVLVELQDKQAPGLSTPEEGYIIK